MNAPSSKRPRHLDEFDSIPAPTLTANRTSFYDNVARTSLSRIPTNPQATTSSMAAPGLPSHLNNGINGTSNSTHLSARRTTNHYSSGAEDNEEMMAPKSSSTAPGRATRGRGRGRGRGGRGASTAARPHTNHAEDEEVEAPPNPLTFQCRSCFRLLGDSFAFVATDTELGYVILSDVSEIVTQDTVYETSTEPGKDIGSTFARLRCAGCNTTIGRNYRTTPRDLDDLRDCYSLEVDAVYTYQLGSNYTTQTERGLEGDAEGEGRNEKASRAILEEDGLRDKMEKTRALTIELSDRLIRAEEDIRRYSRLVDELVDNKQEDKVTEQVTVQPQEEKEAETEAAVVISEAPHTPSLDRAQSKEPEPAEEGQAMVESGTTPETAARETRATRSKPPETEAPSGPSPVTTPATRSSRRSGLSPARFL